MEVVVQQKFVEAMEAVEADVVKKLSHADGQGIGGLLLLVLLLLLLLLLRLRLLPILQVL